MSTDQPRTPAGSPDGGQFAATSGAEATATLTHQLLEGGVAPNQSLRTMVRSYLPLDEDPGLESTAAAITEAVYSTNRSEIDAGGNIRGTFTTREFDNNADTVEPLPSLPEDLPFGRVTETHVEYADSGAVMTTFHTTNGTEVNVEIVDQDEDHGPIITINTPDGACGTYYSDGEWAWDDEIDDAKPLVRYGAALHSRVMQVESAVRYAALAAARDNIMAIATGARQGSDLARSAQ